MTRVDLVENALSDAVIGERPDAEAVFLELRGLEVPIRNLLLLSVDYDFDVDVVAPHADVEVIRAAGEFETVVSERTHAIEEFFCANVAELTCDNRDGTFFRTHFSSYQTPFFSHIASLRCMG